VCGGVGVWVWMGCVGVWLWVGCARGRGVEVVVLVVVLPPSSGGGAANVCVRSSLHQSVLTQTELCTYAVCMCVCELVLVSVCADTAQSAHAWSCLQCVCLCVRAQQLPVCADAIQTVHTHACPLCVRVRSFVCAA